MKIKNIFPAIVLAAGMLVLVLASGCASHAQQNDVYSYNPHTGQTQQDLTYQGGVRSVGGVYRKELVRTAVCQTNEDGTVFEDHTAKIEKGFHFPQLFPDGLFNIFVVNTEIPCIPQAPQCSAPGYYQQSYRPQPIQIRRPAPCAPSYYPSPGY